MSCCRFFTYSMKSKLAFVSPWYSLTNSSRISSNCNTASRMIVSLCSSVACSFILFNKSDTKTKGNSLLAISRKRFSSDCNSDFNAALLCMVSCFFSTASPPFALYKWCNDSSLSLSSTKIWASFSNSTSISSNSATAWSFWSRSFWTISEDLSFISSLLIFFIFRRISFSKTSNTVIPSIDLIAFFNWLLELSTAISAIFSPSKKKKLDNALGRIFSTNIGQFCVKNSFATPSLYT